MFLVLTHLESTTGLIFLYSFLVAASYRGYHQEEQRASGKHLCTRRAEDGALRGGEGAGGLRRGEAEQDFGRSARSECRNCDSSHRISV